jgi:hypothetical protein
MSDEVLEKAFKIHGHGLHNSSHPGRGVGKLIVCHRHGGGMLAHSLVGKPFLVIGRLRIAGLVHILLLGPTPGILILFVVTST